MTFVPRILQSIMQICRPLAAFVLITAAAQAQQIKAVPQLDDMQMRGAYYQIAHIPSKLDKKCISGATEMVARGDKSNSLLFVTSCKTKSSYAQVHNYTARPASKKSPDGTLKIVTIYPLTRKYNIIATAPDYSWYLSGASNHKSLYIYAKAATLPPETVAQITSIATQNGFDSSKMIPSPQDSTPPKP